MASFEGQITASTLKRMRKTCMKVCRLVATLTSTESRRNAARRDRHRARFRTPAGLRLLNHVRRALQWWRDEADMEKGNLRCEANVSVRRVGEEKFGTKVELKNLNSVRFMQRAIEYEIERQINVIEGGGRVTQETRLWDERAGETRVMRSKEEAHDYRYFPEPDLPPLVVSADFIEGVRASLPELPEERRRRFTEQYGLSYSDASQLTSERSLADYYERAADAANNPRAAANWIRQSYCARWRRKASLPRIALSRPRSWARSCA